MKKRKIENKYDFRKRLFKVHKKNIIDESVLIKENQILIPSVVVIDVDVNSDVINTAVIDFCDFLKTSLSLSGKVGKENPFITVKVDENYKTYKSFKLEVNKNGVQIIAHDDRGVAQALFYIEEQVRIIGNKFLNIQTVEIAPKFSPRMVHSSYGMDLFPDCYLAQIAHAGIDALLVMMVNPTETLGKGANLPDIIERAKKWGIDVYAYSWFGRTPHPDDENCEQFFEDTYGKLFKVNQGLKGVILVGESVGFPSKDPHVSPLTYDDNQIDGIPTGIPSSDFWPCYDYAQWLQKMSDVVLKYNKDADIVFWSYNWGYAPKEARQALIRNLPKNVSLLATFDSFERFEIGPNVYESAYDYSLGYLGPGAYFTSEAEIAKECGIRFYAMTNTAGSTWDFGGTPYVPSPYRWAERAKAVIDCKEKYGVAGLMEGHQHGFTSSVVTDLIKYMYENDTLDIEGKLKEIIAYRFGKENVEKLCEVFKYWSEAMKYMPTSYEEQCGAFRVGASFPFSIKGRFKPKADDDTYGYFMSPSYNVHNNGSESLSCVKLPYQRKMLEEVLKNFDKGIKILNTIPNKNEELYDLTVLGKYIKCMLITGINAKDWFVLTSKLKIASTNKEAQKLIVKLEKIIQKERKNVLNAIPLVSVDSRLGWDPRMSYVADRARLEWKLKLFDYVENTEIKGYKRAINMTDKENSMDDYEFIC